MDNVKFNSKNAGLRLWVIDDDSINNFLMHNMLSEISVVESFDIFTNANQALNQLHILKGKSPDLDIVILDLNMPEMDGFEFLEVYEKEIMQYMPHVKVAIVTSSSLSRDKAKAANYSSVLCYITKPITEEVLQELYIDYHRTGHK